MAEDLKTSSSVGTATPSAPSPNYPLGPAVLRIGSDVEIAKRVIEDLRAAHGDVVFDEGQVWFYDGTSWQPKSDRDLRLIVHAATAPVPNPAGTVGR